MQTLPVKPEDDNIKEFSDRHTRLNLGTLFRQKNYKAPIINWGIGVVLKTC
jgi:hypothetical protein